MVATHHGAKLVVRVACEIFSNCPRYLPDLVHDQASPYVPRPGSLPPAPEWKQRDYIRDILPRDDPHGSRNPKGGVSGRTTVLKQLPLRLRSAGYALRGGFLVRPLVIAVVLGLCGAVLSSLEEVVPAIATWVPAMLFPSHEDAQVAQADPQRDRRSRS